MGFYHPTRLANEEDNASKRSDDPTMQDHLHRGSFPDAQKSRSEYFSRESSFS